MPEYSAPALQLIRNSDYKRMPWKNGRGFTDEIAIHPPQAKFPQDRFLWRLSAAAISEPNTFSQFVGYDRWLGIWRGEGLVLDGCPLRFGEAVRFPGERAVTCTPVRGSVLDLGLVFDRESVDARFVFERLSEGTHVRRFHEGVHFLVGAKGEFSAQGLSLKGGDTLRIEGTGELTLSSRDVIEIYFITIQGKRRISI